MAGSRLVEVESRYISQVKKINSLHKCFKGQNSAAILPSLFLLSHTGESRLAEFLTFGKAFNLVNLFLN
jgi:hypothetical protein